MSASRADPAAPAGRSAALLPHTRTRLAVPPMARYRPDTRRHGARAMPQPSRNLASARQPTSERTSAHTRTFIAADGDGHTIGGERPPPMRSAAA